MFLRNFRFLTASLVAAAAFFANSSRASADVQVLVTDLGPGGGIVYNNTTSNTSLLLSSANFSSINLSFSNPGADTSLYNLGTTYIVSAGTNGAQLAVEVTYVGPTGNGLPALDGATVNFTNSITSNLSGFTGQTLTNTSSVYDFDGPLLDAKAQLTATATSPNPGIASSPLSVFNNLAEAYKVKQVFTIAPVGAGTFNGTVTSGLLANPPAVPAPPAILLAAMAFPAFGLRRMLRRKTA